MVKMVRVLIIILFLLSFISNSRAALVNGTVYEWSDFEKPLRNVIIEVEENSTRVQYKISTTGEYEFDLTPGDYTIKAKYYHNNILELIGEDKIRIDSQDENRNFDLLLFPPTDTEYQYIGDINLSNDTNVTGGNNINIYIVYTLIIVLSGCIAFYWLRKKSSNSETIINEPVTAPSTEVIETRARELPLDLQELYNLILKTGGRTTQKELRKKISYSEAKVSLMLDDLESRGFIKKIKKGRSNIIIAEIQKN